MPAISSRFYTFFLVLLIQSATPAVADNTLPEADADTLTRLGYRIYGNECAWQSDCLTAWNPGETFPSLGIGHFIWFRADQHEPFEETFPRLLAYLQQHGVALPDWLAAAGSAESPWTSREQFYADFSDGRLGGLRQLLAATQALQTGFIVERFFDTVPQLLAAAPAPQRPALRRRIQTLADHESPYGLYALVDYVHFKGTGLNPGERYQDEGWGLLQVLQAMPDSGPDLHSFVSAAESRLRLRVQNAPPERNEQRWLDGWLTRLHTYLPESGSLSAPAAAAPADQ